MAVIRWEPAREINSLQQEVNRLFGSFFDTQAGAAPAAPRRWIPAMDLVEQGEHYVLRADLPGVSEDDVNVELDENVLTISGERRSEHDEQHDGYRRIERASGSFSRSLTLPDGVDPAGVRARFQHGVLEVAVPKPVQRKPQRVAISVGAEQPAVVEAGTSDGHRESDS
ncbi:MAG TPA: Hsp20/alpha crystallin family protein [Solirubrobacteraceae bacterium]|nr:Hsp20/alpha crystallin family protein [Solirubrobacteraceae bacterium]